jgi:hypothetical protein
MANYETWEEAAAGVLGSVEWEARTAPSSQMPDPLVPVEQYISAWMLGLQDGSRKFDQTELEIVTNLIVRAGVVALHEIAKQGIPYRSNGMLDLLIRKQHDYGHDNINNFGTIGIAIRVCDKIARIRNLRNRGSDGQAEPLQDAYLDLVGYATIAHMYHHGWFQLPLEGDKK